MDLKIPLILINTFLSASFGLIFSSILGIFVMKKPEPLFMITGPLAGLVSITASCAYVNPSEAIFIGSIGGLLSGFGIVLLENLKIYVDVNYIEIINLYDRYGWMINDEVIKYF